MLPPLRLERSGIHLPKRRTRPRYPHHRKRRAPRRILHLHYSIFISYDSYRSLVKPIDLQDDPSLTVPHHLARTPQGCLEDADSGILDVSTDDFAEEGFRRGGRAPETEEEGVEEVVAHGLPADG